MRLCVRIFGGEFADEVAFEAKFAGAPGGKSASRMAKPSRCEATGTT